ncbi:MAG: glycosyltransferase family 4 protein [Hyphomicrobiaceae bacterium]
MRILHVLRAPVGGLFRHVVDLASVQAARGHDVGVLCDSAANDSLTEGRLAALAGKLSLGLHRTAMARDIGWLDYPATRATIRIAHRLGVDVLHGHGAKGGAYARLAALQMKRRQRGIVALYTPHGGSLHYAPTSLKGRVFMALERALAASTDAIVFESAYSSRIYAANIGISPRITTRVIPNGIRSDELEPVAAADDAADFVFVGELRHLKGVDLMLEALARIDRPRSATAVIVGDGPDAARFKEQATALGLDGRTSFPGAMPARRAFALGRSLVMPSRAESFPYIVLEAGGAGLPLIASDVGGIPEIIAGTTVSLVAPENVDALAARMHDHLVDPATAARAAASLRDVIAQRYSVDVMANAVTALYGELLEGARSGDVMAATVPAPGE